MACAQRHTYLPSSDEVREQTKLHHWRFHRLSACTPSEPHPCHPHHAAVSLVLLFFLLLCLIELLNRLRRWAKAVWVLPDCDFGSIWIFTVGRIGRANEIRCVLATGR